MVLSLTSVSAVGNGGSLVIDASQQIDQPLIAGNYYFSCQLGYGDIAID